MASFVDSTVKDIDERLRELKQEVTRLEAARAALVGTRRGPGRPPGSRGNNASANNSSSASTPTRRRSTRRSTRRPGRPRGRRSGNTRANQALELVRSQPGITIPQLAEAMKIQPNYLYRVMPRLVADGQIERKDQGWHPASS